MDIKSRKGSTRFPASVFILAVAVIFLSIYLLDKYNIPSHVELAARDYFRGVSLSLDPIVVSDSEILAAIGPRMYGQKGPPYDSLQELEEFWGAYIEYRRKTAPYLTVHPADVGQIAALLADRHPVEAEAIVGMADRYANGYFGAFGDHDAQFGKHFTWTTYPSRENDVIFIWEVNTLQHFPILAQAYRITGRPLYRVAIRKQLTSWLADNPIDNSVNWQANMEVSLRLYSLIWTFNLLLDDPESTVLIPSLTKTIFAHTRFVRRTIDAPRKSNNHGLFSALCLWMATMAFPEFPDAAANSEFALARILEELKLQYTEDGAHTEFSPTYHKALFDGVMHFVIAAQNNGVPLPDWVRDSLAKQARFLDTVSSPSGEVLLLNDSDDHHFIRLSSRDYRSSRESLHVAAKLLSHPWSSNKQSAHWLSTWLFGLGPSGSSTAEDGRNLAFALPNSVYQSEGYFRLSAGPWTLFGDLGTYGAHKTFSGHSHADTSSYLLWFDKNELLIDAGTFTYRDSKWNPFDNYWRSYFRSSSAHNTVTINDAPQAIFKGEFSIEPWSAASIEFVKQAEAYSVVGGRYSPALGEDAWEGWRYFYVDSSRVVIVDWFPAANNINEFQLNFLFGRDIEPEGDATYIMDGGIKLGLHLSNEESLIKTATLDRGWRSVEYGDMQPSPKLTAVVQATGAAAIVHDWNTGNVEEVYFAKAMDDRLERTIVIPSDDKDLHLNLEADGGMTITSVQKNAM